MSLLTNEQAYAAMFIFLDELWKRTQSEDLAGFLGGMSLLADGSTADGAVAVDWRHAVERALKGEKAASLKFQ